MQNKFRYPNYFLRTKKNSNCVSTGIIILVSQVTEETFSILEKKFEEKEKEEEEEKKQENITKVSDNEVIRAIESGDNFIIKLLKFENIKKSEINPDKIKNLIQKKKFDDYGYITMQVKGKTLITEIHMDGHNKGLRFCEELIEELYFEKKESKIIFHFKVENCEMDLSEVKLENDNQSSSYEKIKETLDAACSKNYFLIWTWFATQVIFVTGSFYGVYWFMQNKLDSVWSKE